MPIFVGVGWIGSSNDSGVVENCHFYARQQCYSALYATPIPSVDLSVGLSVRLSVCLSYACIVSKRLNASSKFFHHLIDPSFQFFVTKGCCVNLTASPLTGAPNTTGVACQFSTNMRLNLGKGTRQRHIVTMEDEYKVVCALSNSATMTLIE